MVQDRMTSPALATTPETETRRALQTMYVHKIRRLPVVTERGDLLGIVTQRDLYEKGEAVTPVSAIMTASGASPPTPPYAGVAARSWRRPVIA